MAKRERRIRKSQMISPYGVGSIVEFPKESLMHAGLDAWGPKEEQSLADDRLANRLQVRIFYEPAPAPERNQPGQHIPFVRFPLWHVCPRCRAMKKAEWNMRKPPRCDSDITPRFKGPPCASFNEKWRKPSMVPVRFVVACSHGHVEDFPWVVWAHSKEKKLLRGVGCNNPKLQLNATGRSGLMGLTVHCKNCNAKRAMTGAAGQDTLKDYGCGGERPWLGPDAKEKCMSEVPPRVTQRGATNIYFSKIVSSILIPPYSTYVRRLIGKPKNWTLITNGVDEVGNVDKTRVKVLSESWEIPFDELMAAINQKLNGVPERADQSEENYRYDEYKAFKAGKDRKTENDLNVDPQDMSQYDQDVAKYFSDIILVEKLTETRALTGFTRMSPAGSGGDSSTKTAALSIQHQDWLPAVRGYGEGIFFTIKQSLLDDWSQSIEVRKRVKLLSDRMDTVRTERSQALREITPVFLLLHSLAHILINRLSFDCGYGSSSLRERIYCRQTGEEKMAGILIYTSASDSEGTLGGLVQQGKHERFEPVVRQALVDSMNCSSDPLCTESRGQGTDALNLAACHACALLPETSCEEGNRLLDRLLLIGTPEDTEVGIFGSLVSELIGG